MTKQKNKKIKYRIAEKSDLISRLPDSILCHILSFLDTKSASATCLLSKRWNRVLANVQVLDFKYDEGTSTFRYNLPFPALPVNPIYRFTRWVRNVLSKRENSPLTKFHLSVPRDVDPNFIQDCIVYALNHNVKQLKIRAFCASLQLPGVFYACKSLTSLKLSNVVCNSIELPSSFPPNLKILRLSRFILPNKNKGFFSGCSNLEILVLYKCKLAASPEVKILEISCLQLKKLEILYWRSPYETLFEESICVNAPQLVGFTFKGIITKVQFLDDLPLLQTVVMDLDHASIRSCINFDLIDSHIEKLLENWLKKFHTMKLLSLSMNTVEIIPRCSGLYTVQPKELEEVAELLVLLRGAETKTQSDTHGLEESATFYHPNLQQLNFTVKDKCAEVFLPVNTVKHLLECSGNTKLVLDFSQDHKLSALDVRYSVIKGEMQSESEITFSGDIITYYLEKAPSLKSIVIEIPEASVLE